MLFRIAQSSRPCLVSKCHVTSSLVAKDLWQTSQFLGRSRSVDPSSWGIGEREGGAAWACRGKGDVGGWRGPAGAACVGGRGPAEAAYVGGRGPPGAALGRG